MQIHFSWFLREDQDKSPAKDSSKGRGGEKEVLRGRDKETASKDKETATKVKEDRRRRLGQFSL